MRKRLLALIPLLTIPLVACTDQPTAASDGDAVDVPTLSKGAVKNLPDPECAVIDGNGDLFGVGCMQQLATYSRNGNAVAVVKASGVPNPTGKAVHWDAYNPGRGLLEIYVDIYGLLDGPPIPCVIPDVNGDWTLWTLNWKGMVSASGNATMRCVYSKNFEFQWPD
jgi:hypothetical protein